MNYCMHDLDLDNTRCVLCDPPALIGRATRHDHQLMGGPSWCEPLAHVSPKYPPRSLTVGDDTLGDQAWQGDPPRGGFATPSDPPTGDWLEVESYAVRALNARVVTLLDPELTPDVISAVRDRAFCSQYVARVYVDGDSWSVTCVHGSVGEHDYEDESGRVYVCLGADEEEVIWADEVW